MISNQCKSVIVCIFLLTGLSSARGDLLTLGPFNCSSGYCDDIVINFEIVALNEDVGITFFNNSSVESSIRALYFEKGVLDGIVGFESCCVTLFVEGANPAGLPGSNLLEPAFTTAYSAAAIQPPMHNGIEPGEQLTVIFDLDEGATLAELMEQLHLGTFRIGAHIISLPDGSSLSAVNTVAPEPSALLLLGLGALALLRKSTHNRLLRKRRICVKGM